MWGFSPNTLDFVAVSHLPHGSIYNKQPLIHSSNIKAPLTLHVNTEIKQDRAKTRSDLLHESLMFQSAHEEAADQYADEIG